MINTILIFASIVIFAVIIAMLYFTAKNQKVKKIEEQINSFEKVLEIVKNEIVDILNTDYSLSLSDEEFERMYKRKARLNDALKNCVYGIDSAKILVIDLIRSILVERVPPEKVSWLLGLQEGMEPSNHVKFEILMYKYKKRYGKQALAKWIEKYDLAREKPATFQDRQQDQAYYITEEELDMTYKAENFELTIDEQYDILAILVYQQYKGFGILDTLREMDINGFNCGTSGSILSATNKLARGEFRASKSVWLYYQGKYIHLRFMDFGSEEELKRIIQLLIRYGNPGPLTAKRGYLVNTMYDKSRILALRPPASEYWAVFVRKFTLSDVSPEALIIKDYTKRGDLPVQLIEFLMRGMITCAVTGRQGSGKTTLMSSIIRYIDPRYTIRVLEMAPELYLRELYPTRNILSVQETTTVTAAELQDALKKSDAAVSIVGEVATDEVAARMIQMGQVASLFTIFSHHANTAKDLVLALRNSLVNSGAFNNMQVAEKQVLDVVKVDIHLDYTPDGKRYIERITEIVPLPEGVPYPEYDPNDPVNSMNKITREFYQRTTDRVGFYTHDILRYDLETHTYYTVDRFSPALEEKIRKNLGKELRVLFDYFMIKEWDLARKDLSEEERAKKLEELKRLEQYVEKLKRDKDSTQKEIKAPIEENKTGAQIEEEAAEKALWAEGYAEGEKVDEFTLSLFFDDASEDK